MSVNKIDKAALELKAEKALSEKGYLVTVLWDKKTSRKGHPCVDVLCNICNKTSAKVTHALRQGQYACEHCVVDNYKKLLSESGYTYLSHGKGNTDVVCNTCGTQKSIHSSTPTKGHTPKCDICLQNKYKEKANSIGFDLLKKFNPKDRRATMVLLSCQKDKAEETVPAGSLMRDLVRCKKCQEQAYIDALLIRNCTFISSTNVPHKHYKGESVKMVKYKNTEGDVFERTSGLILSGEFATKAENRWTAGHSTYLVETIFCGHIYYKIGIAVTPDKRLRDLKLEGESRVFTLESFSDRMGADILESKLHQEFKRFKLHPNVAREFTTAKIKVKRVGQTERVYVKDGIHEWFTHEVYDILKHRYKLE